VEHNVCTESILHQGFVASPNWEKHRFNASENLRTGEEHSFVSSMQKYELLRKE